MDLQTLTVDDVTRIYNHLVDEFAESDRPILPAGVRNNDLLHSAVSRQATSLGGVLKYPDAIASSASLTYGICCNHVFFNGNKRTALVAMLAHLDRNKITLYGASFDDLEKLIIRVADHTLPEHIVKDEGRDCLNENGTDREVEALTFWLRKKSRTIRRGERIITYRELSRILKRHNYHLENKDGNTIEIVKFEMQRRSFFGKPEPVRIHVTTIPFPGDRTEVGLNLIKNIRMVCRLREEDGCDSAAFYDNDEMISYFINRYRVILRRLANK